MSIAYRPYGMLTVMEDVTKVNQVLSLVTLAFDARGELLVLDQVVLCL